MPSLMSSAVSVERSDEKHLQPDETGCNRVGLLLLTEHFGYATPLRRGAAPTLATGRRSDASPTPWLRS